MSGVNDSEIKVVQNAVYLSILLAIHDIAEADVAMLDLWDLIQPAIRFSPMSGSLQREPKPQDSP